MPGGRSMLTVIGPALASGPTLVSPTQYSGSMARRGEPCEAVICGTFVAALAPVKVTVARSWTPLLLPDTLTLEAPIDGSARKADSIWLVVALKGRLGVVLPLKESLKFPEVASPTVICWNSLVAGAEPSVTVEVSRGTLVPPGMKWVGLWWRSRAKTGAA